MRMVVMIALTALGLCGVASAQEVLPPPVPPAPVAPPPADFDTQLNELRALAIDSARSGYSNCMRYALFDHAQRNAPGGDVSAFQPPATIAERDAMADFIIAQCAEGRARLMSDLDAIVAKQAPFGKPTQQFVDAIRAEFESMDEELRTNLRNAEPKPAE